MFSRLSFSNKLLTRVIRHTSSPLLYKGNFKFSNNTYNTYNITNTHCSNSYNFHNRFPLVKINKRSKTVERKVFIDVETTGLSHYTDRIIEICAIEVLDGKVGSSWHSYVNPCGKKSSKKAQECHKLDANMLKSRPKFKEIMNKFLDFIGNSTLIAHNAQFDIHFLNSELKRGKKKPLTNDKICTLKFSRKLNPMEKTHTLNALCDRYNIDKEDRDKYGHNSKIDTELLTQVYDKLWNDVQSNNNRDEILSASKYYISDDKWIN